MKIMSPYYSFLKTFFALLLLFTFSASGICAQEFTKVTNISLPGIHDSSISWGDYDNDGDLDILMTGSLTSRIYKNNGDGTFSALTSVSLPGVESGSAAWGDYNNDGYLDILLTGWNGGTSISKIYRNLGNGSFSELTSVSLAEVNTGSAVWGDYNKDGFLDILLTGIGKSVIFKNKGNGTFSEQTSISLQGMYNCSASWGDYNNDGFMDILLTGWDNSFIPTSQIYKNNGDGTFSLQTNIKLTGVSFCSAAWGDYDNDGYLDVLLAGSTNNVPVSKIYKNNQDGTFSEQTSISMTGVDHSSVAWGDYNNDGYLDILLTGKTVNGAVSKIYKNNGNGTFTEQTSESLTGIESGSATWADYDNDGDLDILLAGSGVAQIYQNNNNKVNTAPSAPNNLNAAVSYNKVTFSWDKSSDNETPQNGLNYNLVIGTSSNVANVVSSMSDRSSGYRRVVRMGNIQTNNSLSYVLPGGTYYWSVQAIDGAFAGSKFQQEKTFTIQQPVKITSPLPGEVWIVSSQHSITWSENRVANIKAEYSVNNGLSWYTIADSIPSDKGSYSWTIPNKISNECKIRLSDAANANSFSLSDSTFSIVGLMSEVGHVFPSDTAGSSVAWGDYDNDGDLDLLISGGNGNIYEAFSKVYKNNGDGTFSQQNKIALANIAGGSAAWGDYNNDGYLDILLTGSDYNYFRSSKVYKNNGDGTFSPQTNIYLTGVDHSSVAWGDYNNDGYLDILLTGNSSGGAISKVYKNNKNGTFSEQKSISLTGLEYGSADWGDFDNDGDLDILLTGSGVSEIYRNNGDGSFTKQTSTGLPGVFYSSSVCGDFDNDGDLDILLTGSSLSNPLSKVYFNNRNGTFREQAGSSMTGISLGSASCADFDNDGYLDILLTGSGISKIYKNNGNGTFTERTDISLAKATFGTAIWGDYDNDGTLDILLTGYYSDNGSRFIKIYKNNSSVHNTYPTAPANLKTVVDGNKVTFSWDKSSDNETPQNGLNYNLVIGTASTDGNVVSSMSDRSSGYRRVVSMGNVETNNSISYVLPEGTYYWSVQAIDAAFAGSQFSPEKSFTVQLTEVQENSNQIKDYKLLQNYPNPFNPTTNITFLLPVGQKVKLAVFDMLGKEITTLLDEYVQAGSHSVKFDASSLPNGVYIYTLQADQFRDAKKLILLK